MSSGGSVSVLSQSDGATAPSAAVASGTSIGSFTCPVAHDGTFMFATSSGAVPSTNTVRWLSTHSSTNGTAAS